MQQRHSYDSNTGAVWLAVGALLLMAIIGCGSGRATVQGSVTLDGSPVDGAQIIFEPADRTGPTAGGRIENGSYRLSGESGVPPGEKIVRITGTRPTGRKVEAGPPSPPGTMVDVIERFIPLAYNRGSKLKCEVVAGTNTYDFQLTSQPE